MGKVPKNAECPIDNLLVDLSDLLSPLFKTLGFTPNGITTLSLLFGLLSIFLLFKGYVWLFAITYFISFFFDCMDGYFARKYNMTSKGGDWYDHIKDAIVSIILFIIVILRYKNTCSPKTWLIVGIIFAFFFIMSTTLVGCQAREYKDGESMFLYRKLCIGDPNKNIKWMRYFGCGTTVIVVIILIVLMEKKICI
jgi:phosphatidylglycerophosphate synthase